MAQLEIPTNGKIIIQNSEIITSDSGQQSMFGTDNLSPQYIYDQSILLLREFEAIALHRHPLGYVVGYSGGKDSDVMIELFIAAGVKFHVIHNHTTLDAPETVYYIRKKFAEFEGGGISCKIYYPQRSFWDLCYHKLMMPTRIARFCCTELKEKQIPELRFATHSFGVRKAESTSRAAKRDSIEFRNRLRPTDVKKFHFDNTEEVKQTDMCYTFNYFIVNPLAYWTDKNIWDFIGGNNLEINPLYCQGFNRVGCIGCPMASTHRLVEFERYPKYEKLFIKLCDKIIKERTRQGKPNKYGFKDGQEYFDFWLEIDPKKAAARMAADDGYSLLDYMGDIENE